MRTKDRIVGPYDTPYRNSEYQKRALYRRDPDLYDAVVSIQISQKEMDNYEG